jgi:hypothetical protein
MSLINSLIAVGAKPTEMKYNRTNRETGESAKTALPESCGFELFIDADHRRDCIATLGVSVVVAKKDADLNCKVSGIEFARALQHESTGTVHRSLIVHQDYTALADATAKRLADAEEARIRTREELAATFVEKSKAETVDA